MKGWVKVGFPDFRKRPTTVPITAVSSAQTTSWLVICSGKFAITQGSWPARAKGPKKTAGAIFIRGK